MSIRLITIADGYESEDVPSDGSGGSIKVEHITLGPTDVTNKYITLAATPADAASVVLSWLGIDQTKDYDFIVVGSKVDFAGYNLETLIQAGDRINVLYQ